MDSKEKTAFILLLDKVDGIFTIFAQNLDCFVPRSDAKRQKVPRPVSRSPASNESSNFEFLNFK